MTIYESWEVMPALTSSLTLASSSLSLSVWLPSTATHASAYFLVYF